MESPITPETQKKIATARAYEYQLDAKRAPEQPRNFQELVMKVVRTLETHRPFDPNSDFGRTVSSLERRILAFSINRLPLAWQVIDQFDPKVSVLGVIDQLGQPRIFRDIPSSMGIAANTHTEIHPITEVKVQPDGHVKVNEFDMSPQLLAKIIRSEAKLKPGFTKHFVYLPFTESDNKPVIIQTDWAGFNHLCKKAGVDPQELTHINLPKPETSKTRHLEGGSASIKSPDHDYQDAVCDYPLPGGHRYVLIDMSGGSSADEQKIAFKKQTLIDSFVKNPNLDPSSLILTGHTAAQALPHNESYGTAVVVDVLPQPNGSYRIRWAECGDEALVARHPAGFAHRRHPQSWPDNPGLPGPLQLLNTPDNRSYNQKRRQVNTFAAPTGHLDIAPGANTINSALGSTDIPIIHTGEVVLPPGSVLLVGSDGARLGGQALAPEQDPHGYATKVVQAVDRLISNHSTAQTIASEIASAAKTTPTHTSSGDIHESDDITVWAIKLP